eukprot:689185-Pelagomonas_calceolata.AAC.1
MKSMLTLSHLLPGMDNGCISRACLIALTRLTVAHIVNHIRPEGLGCDVVVCGVCNQQHAWPIELSGHQ